MNLLMGISDDTLKVLIVTIGSIATGIIGIIGPIVLFVIAKLRQKQNLDSIKIDDNAKKLDDNSNKIDKIDFNNQKLNQKLDENTDITQEVKETQIGNSQKLQAIHDVGNHTLEVQLENNVMQASHIVDLLKELDGAPDRIAAAIATLESAKKLLEDHKMKI